MPPKVSIVLLNWNSSEHTIECIESLQRIKYENYSITIVDNNSQIKDIANLRNYLKNRDGGSLRNFEYYECGINNVGGREITPGDITLVLNDSNDGFPGGCNIGIRQALENDYDYVLLLNNDVVVDELFLNELVSAAESDESVGIAGSKIYYYDQPNTIQSIGGDMWWWMFRPINYGSGHTDTDGKFDKLEKRDFVWATSQLIDTSVFEDVGLLDEKFFFGIEEYDLCDRAQKRDYTILFVPSSKVWHKGHASAKKLDDFTDTKTLINNETGFLDYKLIQHALRKHYGDYIWVIPFLLRYISKMPTYLYHMLKQNGNEQNNI